MIIDNWKEAGATLAAAGSIDSVSEFAQMSAELKKEFDDSFTTNRSGFVATLYELETWLDQVLKTYTVVSVLGV